MYGPAYYMSTAVVVTGSPGSAGRDIQAASRGGTYTLRDRCKALRYTIPAQKQSVPRCGSSRQRIVLKVAQVSETHVSVDPVRPQIRLRRAHVHTVCVL